MKHARMVGWISGFLCLTLSACSSSKTACEGTGCGDAGGIDSGLIVLPDAGIALLSDSGGPISCDMPPAMGAVGGRCNAGNTCNGTLGCLPAQSERPTVRSALPLIAQARLVPGFTDRYEALPTPDPSQDVAITLGVTSLCTQTCDITSPLDTCGPCAACWDGLGQDRVGLPVGFFVNSTFGVNAGLCRPFCDYDPASNGGCGEGFSCDPLTALCLEACVDDAQCNARTVTLEDGNLGTYIDPVGAATCNPTTGRCTWTAAGDPQPGDACQRDSDCAPDVGACSRGSCVELGCVDRTTDGLCADGNGVCVSGAQCVGGCMSADDCNPGSACVPLINSSGTPVTVGGFSGVCRQTCDAIMNGANDLLIPCGHGEQCDQPVATTETPDPSGVCRPSCDPAAPTCPEAQLCEASAGATFGFCRELDRLCRATSDCYGGQICDVATGSGLSGHCVTACTADSGCTAPKTCILVGEFQGLCATPCTPAAMDTTCSQAQSCVQPTGAMSTYCIQT